MSRGLVTQPQVVKCWLGIHVQNVQSTPWQSCAECALHTLAFMCRMCSPHLGIHVQNVQSTQGEGEGRGEFA
eukprot:252976-Chlamydomonas_euryale.AAC.4